MAISKEVKEQVAQLIREGKIKDVFDVLGQQALGRRHQKNLSLIEADFHRLNEEEAKGTIGFEERELRRNRINARLTDLVVGPSPEVRKRRKRNGLFIAVISIIVLSIAAYFWRTASDSNDGCPEYDGNVKNRILIIPFTNIGNIPASPQIVLRDDINRLTQEKKLSSLARIGEARDVKSIGDAQKIAEECNANVLVWGKYSRSNDSIHIILQYHFLDQPDWSNPGELISLRDVTALQNGKITNDIIDSIMSLCSIIAVRQGEIGLAVKWLGKISHKSEVDLELIKLLE